MLLALALVIVLTPPGPETAFASPSAPRSSPSPAAAGTFATIAPTAAPTASIAPTSVPTATIGPTAAPTAKIVAPSPTASPARPTPPPPSATPTPGRPAIVTLVGAGDIAACDSDGDEATADLLDDIPGTVFTAGDNAYTDGSAGQFARCYDPSWGRHRSRTRPTPGNHDYNTAGARGYYDYFGSAAGDPDEGYYAYDLGAWRIYALNSNCGAIGGCDAGSPQEQWLRADLAANPRACVLAYWHHPLFSSGHHGGDGAVRPLFRALYQANAELVLNGHDHDYERFAPQNPAGVADPVRGIVQIVVGTGGGGHRGFSAIRANSLVRDDATSGVLRVSLGPAGYAFEFVPVAGATFTDGGSGACH